MVPWSRAALQLPPLTEFYLNKKFISMMVSVWDVGFPGYSQYYSLHLDKAAGKGDRVFAGVVAEAHHSHLLRARRQSLQRSRGLPPAFLCHHRCPCITEYKQSAPSPWLTQRRTQRSPCDCRRWRAKTGTWDGFSKARMPYSYQYDLKL